MPRAMALWEEAAGQGDVEAMDQCGHRYIEGAAVAGVPQDLAKVAHWWGRAARAGHAASQYTLGLLYLTGVHAPTVARDEARGARWLRAAAAQGHPTAAWVLDVSDARRRALARQELRTAAARRAAAARRGRSGRRAHAAARAALLLLRRGAAWSSGGGDGGDGDDGSDGGDGSDGEEGGENGGGDGGGGDGGGLVGPAALAEAALAEAAEAAWVVEPMAFTSKERGDGERKPAMLKEAEEAEEEAREEAEEEGEGAEEGEEEEGEEEEEEEEDENEDEAAVAREHTRMVATLRERTAHAEAHAPPATQCIICFEQVEEHARRALPCAPERRHWLCTDCLRADVAFRHSVRQQCAASNARACRPEEAQLGARVCELQAAMLCPFCNRAVPADAAEALLLE